MNRLKVVVLCLAAVFVAASTEQSSASISRVSGITTNFNYDRIQIYSDPGGYLEGVTDIYGTAYPYSPTGPNYGNYGWEVVYSTSSTIILDTDDSNWPYTVPDGFRVLAMTMNFSDLIPDGYTFAVELFKGVLWQAEITKIWDSETATWATGNVAYGGINGLPTSGTPLYDTTYMNVPEPTTFIIWGCLGAVIAGYALRRRNRAA